MPSTDFVGSMRRRLEDYFQFTALKPSWRTELLAGFTTFLTMAYIIFVNPSILKGAGMPPAAGTVATCLSAALGSILMGAYARYPIALAPDMGLNAYFACTVVQGMGVDWRVALGAVVAHPNLSSHRPPQARNVERSLQASRCAGGAGNGDRGGQVPEAVKLNQDVDGAAEGVAQPPHRREALLDPGRSDVLPARAAARGVEGQHLDGLDAVALHQPAHDPHRIFAERCAWGGAAAAAWAQGLARDHAASARLIPRRDTPGWRKRMSYGGGHDFSFALDRETALGPRASRFLPSSSVWFQPAANTSSTALGRLASDNRPGAIMGHSASLRTAS
jgi:hypothetical protein